MQIGFAPKKDGGTGMWRTDSSPETRVKAVSPPSGGPDTDFWRDPTASGGFPAGFLARGRACHSVWPECPALIALSRRPA